MGLLDEIAGTQSNTLNGSKSVFIDGDTLSNPDSEHNFRLRGFDTPETAKFINGGIKEGTAGGLDATRIISKLANDQGYTTEVPQFNPDGSIEWDKGGSRQMVELKNDKGESFSRMLLASGAMDLTSFSNKYDMLAKEEYQNSKDRRLAMGDSSDSDFDTAARELDKAELEDGAKSFGFKKQLTDEFQRSDYINSFMAQGMTKKQAISEMDKYFTGDVSVSRSGVDVNNRSLNPKTDALKMGLVSLGESAFGVSNMLGYATDQQGLESWGASNVSNQRAKFRQFGDTINNYKDVKSIGNAFEYIAVNMAMSLPYMAVTAAGTLAAPFTFGASLSLPVATYAGLTWNEMEGPNENKSVALAAGAGVAMAVLDRLGLKGIAGAGLKSNPTKYIRDAIPALAAKSKISITDAGVIVKREADRAIAEFADEAQAIAKSQLTAAENVKAITKRIGVGGLSEGLTEVGQESIGYAAAVAGSDKVFDFVELQDRLANAAVAGTALGGSFAIPGTIKDRVAWMDAAALYGKPITESEVERYVAEEKSIFGKVRSITDVLTGQRRKIRNTGLGGADMAERASSHRSKKSSTPFLERAANAAMNPSKLWRGSVTSAVQKHMAKYPSARKIGAIMGGLLTPLHGGSGIEAAKHHLTTIYKNKISDPKLFYKAMGLSSFAGVFKSSARAQKSSEIYKILRAARDKNGTGDFNERLVPQDTPNRQLIVNLGNQMTELADSMYRDQKGAGANIDRLSAYLLRYKSLDKIAIQKNRAGFKKALVETMNVNPGRADALIDEILDNPMVNDLGDVEMMQTNNGSLNPSSHKQRTMDLSERSEFSEFYESDIFANIATAAKSSARYVTQMEYIGNDAEIMTSLLNEMRDEGATESEVNELAYDLQNIIEAMDGNYNRPETELGKKLMRFQKNVMFWMTLSALPLATFSSLPELAMTQGALTKEQIFGKNGSIKTFADEGAASFLNIFKQVEQDSDESVLGMGKSGSIGQQMLRRTGMTQWEVGAATTSGVAEVSDTRRNVMEAFFNAIGLTQWTDFTRAMRGSMAYDFISMNSKIVNARIEGTTRPTREAQQAEQKLRSLGIPVEEFVALQVKMENAGPESLTDVEMDLWNRTIVDATYNFINQAVPLPGAANRPLLYLDPRFALFTQFQGFISTFTANQLPRMWNDYVARGTPEMKYNTFVLMSTMILLGFFSQAIKDSIKFDDEDDEGTLGNPYLDTPEYVRRGIMASGLLGTGERIVDIFAPIYGQRSDGAADWIYNQATGESPTVGFVGRLGDAALNLAKGDPERAAYQLLKSTPGIGPFTDTNKNVASVLTGGGWNYKENK